MTDRVESKTILIRGNVIFVSHLSLVECNESVTNSSRSLAFIRPICLRKYTKVKHVTSRVDYMKPYLLACHLFSLEGDIPYYRKLTIYMNSCKARRGGKSS